MDGFTRIPTFASKSEKDKMAEIAHVNMHLLIVY